MLLSHLKRTGGPCKDNYDMNALEEETKRLHREQMAARKLEIYQNDPKESRRKRIASKKYYKKHASEKKAASKKAYQQNPKKKKEAMTTYNEKHREAIRGSMRKKYVETHESGTMFECPICEQKFVVLRDVKRHISNIHSEEISFTCQVCDKTLNYKDNLERHMREVHGGEKHKCDKCPAVFTRASDLQKHTEANWHYLEFECGICSRNLVFKSLAGLIRHVIAKRPEEETESKHPDYKGEKMIWKKSGILLKCRSGEESIKVEEGKRLYGQSKKETGEANKKRLKEKEQYINSGLSAAYGTRETPSVKLEFIEKKHKDNSHEWYCMSCGEKKPYSDENCKFRYREKWLLINW